MFCKNKGLKFMSSAERHEKSLLSSLLLWDPVNQSATQLAITRANGVLSDLILTFPETFLQVNEGWVIFSSSRLCQCCKIPQEVSQAHTGTTTMLRTNLLSLRFHLTWSPASLGVQPKGRRVRVKCSTVSTLSSHSSSAK